MWGFRVWSLAFRDNQAFFLDLGLDLQFRVWGSGLKAWPVDGYLQLTHFSRGWGLGWVNPPSSNGYHKGFL